MEPLTDRQSMILEFIRQSIKERGYPPSLREIGTFMGIKSTNGVNDHLNALERKGYLRRDSMKSRALRPVEPGTADVGEGRAEVAAVDWIDVPLVGRVAAGSFMSAIEVPKKTMRVDPAMLHGAKAGEVFALEVQGDSMIEAGIIEGDTLFVRRSHTANKSDIVVALLGDEATVKRYFPEKDSIRLQPENARLKPIYVHKTAAERDGFSLLGVVVGLYRSV